MLLIVSKSFGTDFSRGFATIVDGVEMLNTSTTKSKTKAMTQTENQRLIHLSNVTIIPCDLKLHFSSGIQNTSSQYWK